MGSSAAPNLPHLRPVLERENAWEMRGQYPHFLRSSRLRPWTWWAGRSRTHHTHTVDDMVARTVSLVLSASRRATCMSPLRERKCTSTWKFGDTMHKRVGQSAMVSQATSTDALLQEVALPVGIH